MKNKSLAFVISCVLVLGFSGIAMGIATTHTDNTGESYVTSVDILEYSAEVYDPDPLTSLPQKINLGLRVKDGGHLPAVIIWDFDVDNNLNSGWANTTTGIVNSVCGGICKDMGGEMYEQGWDFYIILALRDQAATSNVADCLSCTASKFYCLESGPQCSDCDKGDCHSIAMGPSGLPFCDEGEENCYETVEGYDCYCDDARKCGIFDIPCGKMPHIDCSVGLTKGRWLATFGEGKLTPMRGNIDISLNYDVTGETEIQVEFPWGQIVQRIHELKPEIMHGQFDLSYASQNPPVFMVSAFFDSGFEDGDDMWTTSKGMYIDISDWAPDLPVYGVTADWNDTSAAAKKYDLDDDGDCDVFDLLKLFMQLGSRGLPAAFPSRR